MASVGHNLTVFINSEKRKENYLVHRIFNLQAYLLTCCFYLSICLFTSHFFPCRISYLKQHNNLCYLLYASFCFNALTIIIYIIHTIDGEKEVHKNEVTCLRLVLTSG